MVVLYPYIFLWDLYFVNSIVEFNAVFMIMYVKFQINQKYLTICSIIINFQPLVHIKRNVIFYRNDRNINSIEILLFVTDMSKLLNITMA